MADILFNQRVNYPPPIEDPALRQWALDVADALNDLPPMSTFSYETPNSYVTAQVGTVGVNLSSGNTILWYKESGNSNIGWVSIATERAY